MRAHCDFPILRTTSTLPIQVRSWLLLLALSICTSANGAEVPLFQVGTGGRLRDTDISLGYSFQLGHSITLSGLGKHDANGNSLLDDSSPSEIALWNSDTSELLVSTFVGSDAPLREGMFVAPISPLELPAGRYTIAAQFFDEQEPFRTDVTAASPVALVGDITPLSLFGSDFTLPPVGRFLGFGPNLLFEQPDVLLTQPMNNRVVQRREDNRGVVEVAGTFNTATSTAIEVRVVSTGDAAPFKTGWQAAEIADTKFSSQFELPAGGWYEVQARGVKAGQPTTNQVGSQVGVGEVFVIAGQSNSANHGQTRLSATSQRVVTMNAEGLWRAAIDPLPVASGAGGSPWPVFGDRLEELLDVPVGVVSVGWGGTAVGQWLPEASGPDAAGPLYNRLRNALELLGPEGARAVLWHQGESDSQRGTSREEYAASLQQLIAATREDAGYEIPWGVAQAAFLPSTRLTAEEEILAGQLDVIAGDPRVFAGALTEDLLGRDWRHDSVHFNEAGLRLHAERWVNAVLPLVVPEPASVSLLVMGLLIVLPRSFASL